MRNRSALVGFGRFLSGDRSESDPIKFASPVTDMEHFLYQCSCEHANSLTVWSERYRRAKRMHERAVRAHDARGPSTLHGGAARPCARIEARGTRPLDFLWKPDERILKSADFSAATAARRCARKRSMRLANTLGGRL